MGGRLFAENDTPFAHFPKQRSIEPGLRPQEGGCQSASCSLTQPNGNCRKDLSAYDEVAPRFLLRGFTALPQWGLTIEGSVDRPPQYHTSIQVYGIAVGELRSISTGFLPHL